MSISVKPLGAGQEVGRSCVIVKIKDIRVMFDCGVHMAFNDNRKFPDFRKIVENSSDQKPKSNDFRKEEEGIYQNLSNDNLNYNNIIDLVIITHFHLDHCGALPYFTEICGYKGHILMSQPTKAVLPLMLEDFKKIISESRTEKSILTSSNIRDCLNKVKTIEINEEKLLYIESKQKQIKITPFYAGHVLGACMYKIEVDGMSVVYTGDYNTLADRHLGGAYLPKICPDVIITETTYGSTVRDTKRAREREFLTKIQTTIDKGGKVLIPVFSLGRAQELCILLDTHWRRVKSEVPIYFGGQLAGKANFYYKIFNNWMSDKIKNAFLENNIFEFKYITIFEKGVLKQSGPMVIFASPGMLHAGLSLSIFKEIAHDPKNMVIIPGYCIQGTVGNKILSGERFVEIDKQMIEVRCDVQYMSFSAHADAKGILQLLKQANPKNIVFVHGDVEVMKKFKVTIEMSLKIVASMPRNHQEVFFMEEIKMYERVEVRNEFYYFVDFIAKRFLNSTAKNTVDANIEFNIGNCDIFEKNQGKITASFEKSKIRKLFSGNFKIGKIAVTNNFIIKVCENDIKRVFFNDVKRSIISFVKRMKGKVNVEEIVRVLENKDDVNIELNENVSAIKIKWISGNKDKTVYTVIGLIKYYLKEGTEEIEGN